MVPVNLKKSKISDSRFLNGLNYGFFALLWEKTEYLSVVDNSFQYKLLLSNNIIHNISNMCQLQWAQPHSHWLKLCWISLMFFWLNRSKTLQPDWNQNNYQVCVGWSSVRILLATCWTSCTTTDSIIRSGYKAHVLCVNIRNKHHLCPAVTSFVPNIWGRGRTQTEYGALCRSRAGPAPGPAPGGHGHLTLDSLESFNLLLSWPFISISGWDKPEDTADLMRDYQTNAADWFRFAFSSARAWARKFLHLCFCKCLINPCYKSVCRDKAVGRTQTAEIRHPQYSCRFAQDVVRLHALMFCH